MEIKKSNEYKNFVTIIGNRKISKRKVDRIKFDVENGLNLFPYCPIIVSDNEKGTYNIIDGQHRFTASIELGKPIYYVVANDIKLRDIARMNSNTDKWSNTDFLDCYIQLGIEDYKTLKAFIKNYNISLRIAVTLLMKYEVNGGGNDSEVFKNGNFVIKRYNEAVELLQLTDLLFGNYTISRDRNLLDAVKKLKEKNLLDIEKLQEKLVRHKAMVDQQTTSKNYILLIEQIYNMGAQNRKIIY
tara:strand:+ start:1500 stop:2228 length:729 start_codon:yes stop_codon:yes gene_type:complete